MAVATSTNVTSLLRESLNSMPDGSGVSGTFTANGATSVTVVEPRLTSGHSIIPTLVTVGGTVGALPSVKTRTNGVGFTISGTASDTSVYSYKLI